MKLDWAIAGIHTLSPHPGCGLQHPEHARAASAELQQRWSLPLLFGARNVESEIKHQKFLFQNNCFEKFSVSDPYRYRYSFNPDPAQKSESGSKLSVCLELIYGTV